MTPEQKKEYRRNLRENQSAAKKEEVKANNSNSRAKAQACLF